MPMLFVRDTVRTFRARASIDLARYQRRHSFLKGDVAIGERITRTDRRELAVPTIVIYELEYGILRSGMAARRRSEIEVGLGYLQRIPFDESAALAAADIRVHLEKKGALIGPLDLLIAGTALSRAALLVTNNTAEFSRVPGLRTVDWRAEPVAI